MSTLIIEQQQRDRRTGVIVTVLFHVLLTILFLFFGLKQPNPLPEEMGIEIAMANFGTSESGSGQTETPDPGSQQSAAAAAPSPSEDTPDEVATQDDSPIAQPKPEKPKPKPKPKEDPKPKPEKPAEPTISDPLKQALSQWGQGGGQPGQGESQQPGNQGVPDGVQSGVGTFHGDGWSVSLGGRGLMKGPNISDKPSESGRVVLDIFVDRQGKVTRVAFNLAKSTTTSQTLFNIAKKAAMQCTFTPNPSGAAEQKGEMSFTFILQ